MIRPECARNPECFASAILLYPDALQGKCYEPAFNWKHASRADNLKSRANHSEAKTKQTANLKCLSTEPAEEKGKLLVPCKSLGFKLVITSVLEMFDVCTSMDS